MLKNPNVIILAARGSKILPESAGKFHTSIEWLMHAFHENGLTNITIIGGKEIDELAKKYPSVDFYFNPHWEKNGTMSSLTLAEDQLKEGAIITYADVVYQPSLVEKMLREHKGDISVMVDTNWKKRYPKRSKSSLQKAEKIWMNSKDNSIIKTARKCNSFLNVDGEIAGLVYFNPKSGKKLLELYHSLQPKQKFHEASGKGSVGMTDVLNEFAKTKKVKLHAITTKGKWAELDEPQDFGKFIFGTKSQTLERLRPIIKNGTILPQYSFSVIQWKTSAKHILNEVTKISKDSIVIVRSSATNEDSLESSQAGKYVSVMNVDKRNTIQVTKAITEVIQSFGKKPKDEDQILIQPQIQNVSSSGVLFTCDIKTGAHYYVINDDSSGSTDAITAGKKGDQQLYYVYKHSKKKHKIKKIQMLIDCAKQLEKITGNPTLDIEYAFDKKGKLFIFQSRPITSAIALKRYHSYGKNNLIEDTKKIISERLKQKDHLVGSTTILGDMPDWNPAELIGAHPKPLAKSLFEELIAKSAWRDARDKLGYTNPIPERLILTLCGHPYVDVRLSLNSYLPADLDRKIGKKIVNESISFLKKNPATHDKLEFEVATTCYTPSVTDRAKRWNAFKISAKEQTIFKKALQKQTTEIILEHYASIEGLLDMVRSLDVRREKIMKAQKSQISSETIKLLLDDCITNGTVPFSMLARMAFIGTAFLKSFQEKNIIDQKAYTLFLNSIETVATEMGSSLEKVRSGKVSLQSFLGKYGHLRPGTYEIESYRYDVKPKLYFGKNQSALLENSKQHTFHWKKEEKKAMQKSLRAIGLDLSIDKVLLFAKKAIQAREESKFIYTKNISDALELMAAWGERLRLSRSDLSYLDIHQILQFMEQENSPDLKKHIESCIEFAKEQYQQQQQAIMPPLITSELDIEHIRTLGSRPNFITTKSVHGRTCCIDAIHSNKNIDNKIVLIESADPGFDWIFTHPIKGLITKYGGAASHMAIRCAEFDLPAAIGAGEMFESLKNKHSLSIDCANHIIA